MKKQENIDRWGVVDKDTWSSTAIGWENLPEDVIDLIPGNLIYDLPTISCTGDVDIESHIYIQNISDETGLDEYLDIYGDDVRYISLTSPDITLLIPRE